MLIQMYALGDPIKVILVKTENIDETDNETPTDITSIAYEINKNLKIVF